MALSRFVAEATTCDVDPGEEQAQAGRLLIRNRAFVDVVRSEDPRIAGANRPVMEMDLDAETMEGDLRGRFVLTPDQLEGSWEGELEGRLEEGVVTARGIARGAGALLGAVLRVDFQQVPDLPGPPPCEAPKAFFRMNGIILHEG